MKPPLAPITVAIGIRCFTVAAADDDLQTNQKTTKQVPITNAASTTVSVRYMIDDVDAAVTFYTNQLGFTLEENYAPAFAAVVRGNLRLLLSGEKSSGRRALPDGTKPVPGGWNRIQLPVYDIKAEAARLRAAGVKFRRDDIVGGPGGSQIWLVDPSGNLVEFFQSNQREALMKSDLQARHIAVSINRPADRVYEFASNPENLPKWATGLGGTIKKEKGEWVANAPMGKVKIRFTEKNQFGILDHDVVLESGAVVHNPLRVLPNGQRSEVVFSLFRQPNMTDEKFSEDAQWVEKDLKILRDLMERGEP
jgi:catechol 2,3-dioxygenase-like lactoylglutathione lyase family enzyme